MKPICSILAAAVVALTACGNPDTFEIHVDVESLGTQQLTAVYTLADGNRATTGAPAIGGKCTLRGASVEPSLVEIFTANKRPFAALIARNGDELTLSGTSDSTLTVEGEGSELSRLLMAYEPGDSIEKLPEAVGRALAILYPAKLDSLPRFESPELIIAKDSIDTFPAQGIWIFTAAALERKRALIDTIRAYARERDDVRDVYLSTDSMYWRMITRQDSATWTQALLPDAPLRLAGILTTTPLLVETDSAGTVLRVQRLE